MLAFLTEKKRCALCFVSVNIIPFNRFYNLFDSFGSIAGGIKSSDHTAHAGANNKINGDFVVFEGLQDANMTEAAGTAAA